MKAFPESLTACFFLALTLAFHAIPAHSAPATNVAASDGIWSAWVSITWESAYTKGFHNIERSVSAGGTYTRVGQLEIGVSVPDTSFKDTTAVTGTKYYYRVKTCFDITCETSSYDQGWRGYLNAVNRISASDNNISDYTQVSWSSVTGTDYYEVYRSSTVSGAKTLAGTSTSIFFLDREVTPAASFYYYVRACYDNGTKRCSVYYDYDQGRRAWPVVKNVVASDGGHAGFVRVSWDAVSGASGYRVYYSTNYGSTYLGYETATGVESYDYYKSSVGFEYAFAVTPCFNASCGSTKSAQDIGWLDFPAPTNLQASEGGVWTLVTWDEVDSDAWYYVFRDYLNAPQGKTLAGYAAVAETFGEDIASGALPGTHYRYWVVACPSATTSAMDPGCSNYSQPVSGYYMPGNIKTMTASDGTSQDHILVSWDAIDGADSYAIERSQNPFDPNPVWTGPYTSATNQFKDSAVLEGVKYWYVARACGRDYCGNAGPNDSGYLQSVCYALSAQTTGNGTLETNPVNSLGCPGGQYIKGEKIELTAYADPNWDFDSWKNTDDDGITNPTNYLTMPAEAVTVTAAFSIGCEPLYLTTIGDGTLTANPLSSTECKEGSYVAGEVITLKATPDSTWFLSEWFGTGGEPSMDEKIQYTMPANAHTVTAKFSRYCHVLSLNTVGNGSLEAYPEFSKDCPSGSFADGEVVELHAGPDQGWQFEKWTGTDNDTIEGNVNQYTMTASAHTVTAAFSLDCNTLSLSWSGGGSVTASPPSSIGCPAGSYVPDEVINLKAVPDAGWRLGSWHNTNDDASKALTNTCTMGSSYTLNVWAQFLTDEGEIFSSGFEGAGK